MQTLGQRFVIACKEGNYLYGTVISPDGKLGQYEVESDYWGATGHVYHRYSEAANKLWELVKRTENSEKEKANNHSPKNKNGKNKNTHK